MIEFTLPKKEASSHKEDASLNNPKDKKAILSLLGMLQLRDLTEKEAHDKLLKKEYEEDAIAAAIAYAISYGYMGDTYYTGKYYDTYRNRKSQKRMEQDLLNKGVSKEIIRETFMKKELEYADEADSEYEQIQLLLKKKHYNPGEEHSYEETGKVFAYLARKGYSPSKIRRCMNAKNDFAD